jgi:hypothetical protein
MSRIKFLFAATLRIVIVLVPACLLAMGALRATGRTQGVLTVGLAVHLAVCFFTVLRTRSWRQPIAPSVITLYLIALSWLWLSGSPLDDWYQHFAEAILLLIPLAVFAFQALTNSGAPARRRARILAERLAKRKDWPVDLTACRALPDVKALREALHQDATPALNFLFCPIPAVQVAILSALEFHKNWRPGQAEVVLGLAQRSSEPAIRAAAVSALANVDDRLLVEALATFLRDRSADVRRAAMEALLWETGHRWAWIRNAVHHALSDSSLEKDGPLQCVGPQLPAEAVADLRGWASQKGVLAIRSIQTLGAHYKTLLNEQADENLLEELHRQLASSRTAPGLRIELGHLLRKHGHWKDQQLKRLLDPANPAPLRLIAAETLLAKGPDQRATTALREVARLPNREISLATAEIVQRCLGVDLGLPLGQPLPALHSRQAAEITRRVMLWATTPQKAPAESTGDQEANTEQVTAP